MKVKRKENCAVILATQSLSDAKRSGILDVLNESCPTKIFLPNIAAKESSELYYSLGCNESDLEFISEMVPKKHYYFLSPDGRRMFDLALDEYALAFTGVSSKEDVKIIDKLINKFGDKWTNVWTERRMS